MSSIDVETAKNLYKGETEEELIMNMAKAQGCSRIYKYANDYGDKVTFTDFKIIMFAGSDQERALMSSPYVHNLTLVYSDGKVVNKKI